MKVHTVKPGSSTFRNTAEIVISQVLDNYLFTPNTLEVHGLIYSDIVTVLNILWKDMEFKLSPTFNSYSFNFDFTLYVDKNDPIYFSVFYSWDSNDF
jgi:hypothetical protein